MKKLISMAMAMCMMLALIPTAVANGTAPVAENLELKTFVNTSVNGTLSAYDPDGGKLEFEITTNPVRGSIQLLEDGDFIYTPNHDKKGRDYFGYKAIDRDGDHSQEATVIIKIEKPKKAVNYIDMEGQSGEYYAAALREKGIFTGECICGNYFFEPERELSRAEFVCMCIAAAGEPMVKNVMDTGLCDDGDISAFDKSYVIASVMAGFDFGESYRASESINRAEAMTLLNKCFKFTDISYIDKVGSGDEAQACANLEGAGIVREGILREEKLTRLDAAELIVKAMEIKEKRG